MKLKLFQKQDLARAALHDGLILSWDTGLGKTWAIFLWLLLKVGYVRLTENGALRLRPNQPVLIIAPGDLHQQICDEGWTRFRIRVRTLDSQETFGQLCRRDHSALPNLTSDGKPIVPPDFYITSYTQLATNGVTPMPDPEKWNPIALQQWLCLPDEIPGSRLDLPNEDSTWLKHPDFESVCHFFAWRGLRWKDEYHRLSLHPDDTLGDLEKAYEREMEATRFIQDDRLRGKAQEAINEAKQILQHLFTDRACPKFAQLADFQQDFVRRAFCYERLERYSENVGLVKCFPIGPLPEGYVVDQPETDTRLKWKIKCVYQPTLADLCYNAFEGVSIDEGVKMKGEETFVGKGVRSMEPKYRLVLTATPVKNRVPDIFRLAWWATGGKAEAHARFPYRDDSTERSKFASTFMVTENNLTKAANARAAEGAAMNNRQLMKALRSNRSGGGGGNRFQKLTAEVCNVHRLWKLLGPIVLRRRKDDCGEDIVPKIRRVIRCEMGTHQQRVYKYHLGADYRDINGRPAIGAQLQALRIAAADPSSSEHLKCDDAHGEPTESCDCTVDTSVVCQPVEGRNEDGAFVEFAWPHMKYIAQEQSDCWNVYCVNGSVQTDSSHPDKEAALKRAMDLSSTHVHRKAPDRDCRQCGGKGSVRLPHCSGQAYIPKHATTLTLIHEILERKEQCVVFSAFTDPLDKLSGWLTEANVRHVKLDGRTSQKKRGQLAAVFKQGREGDSVGTSVPVMLAGVECMAEGHSFHLANNVILIAYSWAYDKFIQAINRVHRMTSHKPVNVYVVICTGTIDRKLESLIGDKGDAAELVLDGRLIGERTEEVNLAELLQIAQREFNSKSKTLDEALLQAQWPQLRDKLSAAMRAWEPEVSLNPHPINPNPKPMRRNVNVRVSKPIAPSHSIHPQTSAPAAPAGDWRQRLAERAARLAKIQRPDAWADL